MPIIHFDTVTKEFSPESYGLKDVTFLVEPGELVFITGHSGSGKTTLMRLLTREYTPTTGEIFFHENPLSTLSKGSVHNHRRKIGVVFQDYRLVPEMNVWENIALPLYISGRKEAEIEQRVTDLLNLIKLPEKADQFPSQLSGGEAQRVSIARALAVGPEVIFADEPTGNLDPDTSRSIARLLRKINELGTTVLIATHDAEVMSDHKDIRQLILEGGQLVKDHAGKSSSSSSNGSEEEKKKSTTKAADKTNKSDDITENTEGESDKSAIQQVIIETTETETIVETPKQEKQSFWSKLFGKKKTKKAKNSKEDKDTSESSSELKEDSDQEEDDAEAKKESKKSETASKDKKTSDDATESNAKKNNSSDRAAKESNNKKKSKKSK